MRPNDPKGKSHTQPNGRQKGRSTTTTTSITTRAHCSQMHKGWMDSVNIPTDSSSRMQQLQVGGVHESAVQPPISRRDAKRTSQIKLTCHSRTERWRKRYGSG